MADTDDNGDLWDQFHRDIVSTRNLKQASALLDTLKSTIQTRHVEQQRDMLRQKIIDYLTENQDAVVFLPPHYASTLEINHPSIGRCDNDSWLNIPYEFTLGGYKWRDVESYELAGAHPDDWQLSRQSNSDRDDLPVLYDAPSNFWVLTERDDPSIDWFQLLEDHLIQHATPNVNKVCFDDVYDNEGVSGKDSYRLLLSCWYWDGDDSKDAKNDDVDSSRVKKARVT